MARQFPAWLLAHIKTTMVSDMRWLYPCEYRGNRTRRSLKEIGLTAYAGVIPGTFGGCAESVNHSHLWPFQAY